MLDATRAKQQRSSFRSRLTPRGNIKRLWEAPPQQHEVMLSGPAETGKTVGTVSWLHEQLMHYPRAQGVMARAQKTDLLGSCVQTYIRHVLDWQSFPFGPSPDGVTAYGGQKPEWFDYPNGARLWLAGLDDPGDALSSERDFIYLNQAEEVARRTYETLLTRVTGRANNVPHPRMLGDCNPGPPRHWILDRERQGQLLKIDTRHEDNPTLFDERGNITERGRRTLAVLDGLTGIEYQRLRLGLWVAAEGTVYKLTDAHLGSGLFDPNKPTQLAVDPSNGAGPYAALVIQQIGQQVLVVGEFYELGGMDEDLRDWLHASPFRKKLTSIVCDPAKPDTIKRLQVMFPGVAVQAKEGKKDITAQIAAVKSLMEPHAVTKQPALVIDRDTCPMLLDEFSQYAWKKHPTNAPDRNISETPEDAHNHCLDALAYWVTTKALTGLVTLPAFAAPTPYRPGWAR